MPQLPTSPVSSATSTTNPPARQAKESPPRHPATPRRCPCIRVLAAHGWAPHAIGRPARLRPTAPPPLAYGASECANHPRLLYPPGNAPQPQPPANHRDGATHKGERRRDISPFFPSLHTMGPSLTPPFSLVLSHCTAPPPLYLPVEVQVHSWPPGRHCHIGHSL